MRGCKVSSPALSYRQVHLPRHLCSILQMEKQAHRGEGSP